MLLVCSVVMVLMTMMLVTMVLLLWCTGIYPLAAIIATGWHTLCLWRYLLTNVLNVW